MSKPKFPITVKRGHTVVKIYRTPSRGCDAFTVSYYLGDQRQRKAFADLGLAMTEAETVANKLSTGEVNVLTLTSDDRLSYIRAIEALKPTGVPLEMAAMQFAEAQKLLEGESLLEAVRFYLKKNPHRRPKKLVTVIVKELIEAKEADKLSDVYVKDLKGRLGRFAAKFPGPISFVTSVEIEDFLRGLKGKDSHGKEKIVLSGKSRNNYRRAIGTLFNFAVARGYRVAQTQNVAQVALEAGNSPRVVFSNYRELVRPADAAKWFGIAPDDEEKVIPMPKVAEA